MEDLVLVSHGRLCEELKGSVEMIMGEQVRIHTVSLLTEEGPRVFEEKFYETTRNLEKYTVFADLYGGTPCNVVTKSLLSGADFDLYAGMNLPMVISFINSELLESQKNILEEGQAAICQVNRLLESQGMDFEED